MPASNPSDLPVDVCTLGKRCPCGPLARRQRLVFDRLLTGNSEKQIAHGIGVSEHTVHDYIAEEIDISIRTLERRRKDFETSGVSAVAGRAQPACFIRID